MAGLLLTDEELELISDLSPEPAKKGRPPVDRRKVDEGRFRECNEELGWGYFECRVWRSAHRHLCLTILSQLYCALLRHRMSEKPHLSDGELLTFEQVRRAMARVIWTALLPPSSRRRCNEKKRHCQAYHQRRNAQSGRSHEQTQRQRLARRGINPNTIKSVDPETP